MGFDLCHVISEERYHGTFVCAICQSLVELDSLVTNTCSHCFCQNCLMLWIDKSSKCPTCNKDLRSNSTTDQSMMLGNNAVLVQPLANAQPLSYRILRQILIRCPLHKGVACSWKGDYGDLQSHLLSSTAHASTDNATAVDEEELKDTSGAVKQQRQLAASLKQEANSQFESKHYGEAKSLYTKAIEVLWKNQESSSVLLVTLYSNRAATYLQMQEYNQCLDDCQYVLQNLDPSNVKIYVRAARASVQLGALERALDYLNQGLKRHPQQTALQKEKEKVQRLIEMLSDGNKQLLSHEHATAKSTFGNLLLEAPVAIPFLLGAADADLGLGLTDSVIRLTKRVLTKHAQNPRGYWIRGQAVFLMGDKEVGIRLLREGLRLDPDSGEIKRSVQLAKQVEEWLAEADRCIFSRQFQQASEFLTSCIQNYKPLPSKSPLYAIIYTKRAEVYLRLKQFHDSLKDCALVLYSQEDHIPAWLIRFQVHHASQDHTTALEEVGEVIRKFNLEQDQRLRRAYERADFLVRKQRRTDFYQLFGVSSIASGMEIKKAYKQKALEFHPDKVAPEASSEERAKAQQRFQLLGEGFEILTDEFQRQLYDEGYDPESIRERVEAAKKAAHNHRDYHRH